MSEQTLNTPTTQEDLASQLNAAVTAGDHGAIDRLMAVEIPDEPELKEDEKEKEDKPEDQADEKSDEDVTKDEPSDKDDDVEDKDEAADDTAASKPDDTKQDTKEDDELTNLRKELHALKSDAGRVPYMQRRLQELERELRDSKLSRKAEEAATKQPAQDNSKPVELPDNLKKKIAALRDIDPDLADTLEEGFKASLPGKGGTADAAQIAKEMIQDAFRQQDEAKEAEFVQTQYDTLVSRIPQAPKIFATQEWKDWKNTLTPGRRALAESAYADEVQIAIGAFVQDMRTQFGDATQTKEAPVTKQTSQEDTEAATKVRENRERKLEASTDTKGPAAKATKARPSDEEQFAADYAKIRKEMGY